MRQKRISYMRENQEQKMVAGLVYIDNYDEALDSIEDVKEISSRCPDRPESQ